MHMQSDVDERRDQAVGRAARAALPPPELARWRAEHKAQIVRALRAHRLTVSEACSRYGLSPEELASWDRAYSWDGERGLTRAGLSWQRRMGNPSG
jgi:transposase-like protein